jgi:raffinose/stachyose/melibiose transport system substrate-binding protein
LIKNSFNFIDITLKYGQNKPLESGWEEIENSLALGNAAMIHMGDWCEPMLKKVNPDVEAGFFPLPVSNNPKDAKVLSNVSWVWKVNKSSKNVAAAKKALSYFLASDEGMKLNAEVFGCVPCTKNVTYKPTGMLAQSALEYVSKGLTLPWPQTQYPDGFELKLGNLYQSYVSKEKTRAQVLTQLTDDWLRLTEQ